MGSTTFWIIAFIGMVFGLIIFIWITQKDKRGDPFMVDFKIKKNQCKMFKDKSIDKVFIENQNDGLVKVGSYEGECVDKEGYHNIMFSKLRLGKIGGFLRKVLFFTRPILDLILKKYWIIRCNVNPILFETIETVSNTGKVKKKVVTHKLPVPTLTKGKGSLIIHCEGLQLKKYYTYPILKSTIGDVIQDERFNFLRERDTVITDTLYQQTIDFSNVMREAINLNPNVRYVVKTEGRTMPSSGGE